MQWKPPNDLTDVVFDEASLAGANLQKVNLSWANLQKANLSWANLREAQLKKAKLQEADLQKAKLQKANLSWANLQGANLQKANLQGANLSWANLQGANLQGANLKRAYLKRAYLTEANLTEANLQGGWLKLVNLTGAFVSETRMQEADLTEANFTNAIGLVARNLAGANLTGAVLPESTNKFRIADSVALTARHARRLFAPLLLAALGVAYLAFSPPGDPAGYEVPLLRIKMPETRFAFFAPLMLLVWNFFFLLYLGRLWQGLAALPAIFPEGVPLTHHPDSWFPITIVRLRLKRLNNIEDWGRSQNNLRLISPHQRIMFFRKYDDLFMFLRKNGDLLGKLLGAGAALLVWGLLPFLMFLMACGFSHLGDFKVNLIAASTFLISLALSLHGFRKAMLELTAAYNDRIESQHRWSVRDLGVFLFFSMPVLFEGWPWWLKLLKLVRSWVAS